jgi:adenine/guanine/hypoxanthine permease
MGLLANLPVGLAPGLGLNAYFTYSVVGFHGSGKITYREALAAVFLEGYDSGSAIIVSQRQLTLRSWIFLFLSIFGIRLWLARVIPRSLTLAVGAGIGLFICAYLGFPSTECHEFYPNLSISSDWIVSKWTRRRRWFVYRPPWSWWLPSSM